MRTVRHRRAHLAWMILYTSRSCFVPLRTSIPPVVILQGPQLDGGLSMVELEKPGFDTASFLASAGQGQRIIQLAPKDAFFSEGDPADSIVLSSERPRKSHR